MMSSPGWPWPTLIGEPTLADAICDRLAYSAVVKLDGPSIRTLRANALGSEAGPTESPEPPVAKPPGARKQD